MKKTIIILVVLILIVAAYFAFFTRPTVTSAPMAATTTDTAPATPVNPVKTPVLPSTTRISIQNLAFSPSSVSIKKGDSVTWTNNDSVAHTVTSDDGTEMNSMSLAPGESFMYTFKNAGTITYHCSIHPSMKGTVTVS